MTGLWQVLGRSDIPFARDGHARLPVRDELVALGRHQAARPHGSARPAEDRRLLDAVARLLLARRSTGGHLLQLVALREAWEGFDARLGDLRRAATRGRCSPARRSFTRTGRRTGTCRTCCATSGSRCASCRGCGPAVIVTTGAGVAVPFAWIGRLFGARVVYVESLTRIDAPVAQPPPDPPGRRRGPTCSGRSCSGRARARSTAAPSSTGRDLRHPRDAGTTPSTGCCAGSTGCRTRSSSCRAAPRPSARRARRWFDYLAYDELVGAHPAGARSSSATRASAR